MEDFEFAPKYEPVIHKEAPMKTYSYKFERGDTLVYDSHGYAYVDPSFADYKLVEGETSEDELREVVRRGDTTYYSPDKITEEALKADIKIIQQVMNTGLYPDGTRRHLITRPPWEWDHYQILKAEFEMQQSGASPSLEQTVTKHPGVDYHYAHADYLLHTGDTKFLTMNAHCTFEDGSRLPADRPAELRDKHLKDKWASLFRRKKIKACC